MKKLTTIEFTERSNIIHNNKYDYSLTEYKKSNEKVIIICLEHDIFKQNPNDHLKGKGCPDCSNNRKLDNKKFIEKSNIIHNNRYDYSLVDYKNNKTKVKIICKEHDVFNQTPNEHLF